MLYKHLPASCKFSRLLMIFANSLNLDQTHTEHQARSGSQLFFKDYFVKQEMLKISADCKNHENYPACKELNKDCRRCKLKSAPVVKYLKYKRKVFIIYYVIKYRKILIKYNANISQP